MSIAIFCQRCQKNLQIFLPELSVYFKTKKLGILNWNTMNVGICVLILATIGLQVHMDV